MSEAPSLGLDGLRLKVSILLDAPALREKRVLVLCNTRFGSLLLPEFGNCSLAEIFLEFTGFAGCFGHHGPELFLELPVKKQPVSLKTGASTSDVS